MVDTEVYAAQALRQDSYYSKAPTNDLAAQNESTPGHGTKKKRGSSGLMRKIFSKKGSKPQEPPQPILEEERSLVYMRRIDDELSGLTVPCPFIRPVPGVKLRARIEPRAFGPKSSYAPRSRRALQYAPSLAKSNSEGSHSSTVTNSADGDATERSIADMSDVADDESDQFDQYYQDIQYDQPNRYDTEIQAESPIGGIRRLISDQICYAASLAAPEDDDTNAQWKCWLGSYSDGRFDINSLPVTPALDPRFQHLPAISPSNELTRLAASTYYESLWQHWGEQKARTCIDYATKTFDTQSAVITCFTKDVEYITAGNISPACWSYRGSSCVSREISIGTHVLLSNEVMVILDTHLDWRFSGNPLVNGEKDSIRFYAATPLSAPDGHIIGILAVFDPFPRTSFSLIQRNELMEQGDLIMKDLNLLASWASPIDQESTIGTSHNTKLVESSPQQVDVSYSYSLLPRTLQSGETKTPLTASTEEFPGHPSTNGFAAHSEDTPPSSISSGVDNASFGSRCSSRGGNPPAMQLVVKPVFESVAPPYDLVTPDSDDYRSCSPRPWSSSDITSLHPHPPNTPAFSLKEEFEQMNFDLTVADFMSLGDEDCAEEQYDQTFNSNATADDSENELWVANQTETSQILYNHNSRPLLETPTQRHKNRSKLPVPKSALDSLPPLPTLPRRIKSPSIQSTPSFTRHPDDSAAAIALRNAARSLDYDLMYAVEMVAPTTVMSNEELLKPGVLKMPLLVAYGMQQPLNLDPWQHIKALRSRGVFHWENEDNHPVDEYSQGRSMAITNEGGLRKHRNNGIVVCAYRYRRQDGLSQKGNSTSEFLKFGEAVNDLKPILLKSRQQQMVQKDNNEPPDTRRYPANEAREVSNSAFDSKHIPVAGPRVNQFGYRIAR